MHRVLVRTVVLDYPSDVHDPARDFWQAALAGGIRRGTTNPEYHVLEHPAAVGSVLVQKLKAGAGRIYLDVEADDTEAEVARLVAAGAEVVERIDDWTVLRDPGGLLFWCPPCSTPASPRSPTRWGPDAPGDYENAESVRTTWTCPTPASASSTTCARDCVPAPTDCIDWTVLRPPSCRPKTSHVTETAVGDDAHGRPGRDLDDESADADAGGDMGRPRPKVHVAQVDGEIAHGEPVVRCHLAGRRRVPLSVADPAAQGDAAGRLDREHGGRRHHHHGHEGQEHGESQPPQARCRGPVPAAPGHQGHRQHEGDGTQAEADPAVGMGPPQAVRQQVGEGDHADDDAEGDHHQAAARRPAPRPQLGHGVFLVVGRDE